MGGLDASGLLGGLDEREACLVGGLDMRGLIDLVGGLDERA